MLGAFGIVIIWSVAFLGSSGALYDLQKDDSNLLLVSTIDGSLVCLDQDTGQVKWKLKEEPVVQMAVKLEEGMPLFLPDPTDGSLYVMGGLNVEALQKLPFTIPQLVSSSPCRSSDGILYTGKKLDTWFSINPKTGRKMALLNSQGLSSTCPREGPDSVFVGRTEYNIVMIDTVNARKMWNITFFDYTSYSMDKETADHFGYVHFTGSSSGRILTLDRDTGALQWHSQVNSPVIAMYLFQKRGLLSVPFTNIAESTLDSLIDEVEIRRNSRLGLEFKPNDLKLMPTLFVGEHIHGLYALPSLVDQHQATIEMSRRGPLLIEGPIGPGPEHLAQQHDTPTVPAVVVLGHYKVPSYSQTRLQIAGAGENVSEEVRGKSVAVQTEEHLLEREREIIWDVLMDLLNGNFSSRNFFALGRHCWTLVRFMAEENFDIKVAMMLVVCFVTAVAWWLHRQMRDIQQMSQSSKQSSFTGGSSRSSLQAAEEIGPGVVVIGKITIFTDQVLGKGCEGTFVFRGEFDSRPVAVKRLLPECFTFADREVNLLRESDAHANVVRYFCTEQDKQFRYIALELCAATLHDYVKGTFVTDKITSMEILLQATQGLAHLHSLHIVHRDIKPHNVLLSAESQSGEVRAMISDFGLCKKLPLGRASFSKRSGITGTDGWIAPEMANGDTRATCAVDIFSMGCVYFYILTNGKHPFGDSLHRQANILSGDFNVKALNHDNQQALKLIERMIAIRPSDRPTTAAVLKHPLFWGQGRVLAFFQDVSDRVEKESEESVVLRRLEESCGVIRGDWRTVIDSEVAEDLRKYRNYRGDSVRDLLRALRNKKHHYRELSRQAQKNLGEIPLEFVQYWTDRFPLLLLHSWLALQCVKREPIFHTYYDPTYNFPRLPHTEATYHPMELEGFTVKKSATLKTKQFPGMDHNWRTQVIANEFISLKEECGWSTWFQMWVASDFRDNNAYIQWQEQEYFKRKSLHQAENADQAFQPEFPNWDYCERLRREKRAMEEENAIGANSSPRRFRRKPNNKKSVEAVAWTLPSS